MYVFSNLIKSDDGKTLGEFRDHYAAFSAYMRLHNPGWKQMAPVWNEDDSIAERKFHAAIEQLPKA